MINQQKWDDTFGVHCKKHPLEETHSFSSQAIAYMRERGAATRYEAIEGLLQLQDSLFQNKPFMREKLMLHNLPARLVTYTNEDLKKSLATIIAEIEELRDPQAYTIPVTLEEIGNPEEIQWNEDISLGTYRDALQAEIARREEVIDDQDRPMSIEDIKKVEGK